MKLSDKVQALIDDENYSAYRIEQETGVRASVVLKLRKPIDDKYHRDISNLTLDSAEKLAHYWDAAMIDIATTAEDQDDPLLRQFPERLSGLFKELINEQIALGKSDDGMEDDQALATVLEQLHDDTLMDNVEVGRLLVTYANSLKK